MQHSAAAEEVIAVRALMLVCDCSVLLRCYLLRRCSKLDEIRKIK